MSRLLKQYEILHGEHKGKVLWFWEDVDGRYVPDGPGSEGVPVMDYDNLHLVERSGQ